MAKDNDKQKTENSKQETICYRYTSHTIIRFTHNQKEITLQHGQQYSGLPADSAIIQNLIDQKRLIKI